MTSTPNFNHEEAREFLTKCMDRLAGTVGAVLSRRTDKGQEWVGPITEEQWRALYTVTEKMMEFVLSLRP